MQPVFVELYTEGKIVVFLLRLPGHCEERSDVAIPWLEGKTIESRLVIHGIATPVCALVRNDRAIGGAIN